MKYSAHSGNLLLRSCPWIGHFKKILQLLVIILSIIIDKDKLLIALMYSKVIPNNKSALPIRLIGPLSPGHNEPKIHLCRATT